MLFVKVLVQHSIFYLNRLQKGVGKKETTENTAHLLLSIQYSPKEYVIVKRKSFVPSGVKTLSHFVW